MNGPPGTSALGLLPVPLLQQQSSARCYQQLWWDKDKRSEHTLDSSLKATLITLICLTDILTSVSWAFYLPHHRY